LIKHNAPSMEDVIQVVRECLGSTDFEVERVFSGASTYVYRAHHMGKLFYLRVLPEKDMSFGVEVYLHRLLRQADVQVPEVIHFEPRHDLLGMSIMLVTEIPGSDASECLSAEMYANLMKDAGRQIARINQIEVDGFGWIVRGGASCELALRAEKGELQDVIDAFLDEDLSVLAERVFSLGDTSRIRGLLREGAVLMTRHPSRLVHGDFDDSHIFQQGGEFTGIIDFGEMQGSSPLYDLGHFKLHDGQRYQGFHALAAGYNEVRVLTSDDHLEIDLWALWIGVRRLGMIINRPYGGYHEHLIRTVKHEIQRIHPMK